MASIDQNKTHIISNFEDQFHQNQLIVSPFERVSSYDQIKLSRLINKNLSQAHNVRYSGSFIHYINLILAQRRSKYFIDFNEMQYEKNKNLVTKLYLKKHEKEMMKQLISFYQFTIPIPQTVLLRANRILLNYYMFKRAKREKIIMSCLESVDELEADKINLEYIENLEKNQENSSDSQVSQKLMSEIKSSDSHQMKRKLFGGNGFNFKTETENSFISHSQEEDDLVELVSDDKKGNMHFDKKKQDQNQYDKFANEKRQMRTRRQKTDNLNESNESKNTNEKYHKNLNQQQSQKEQKKELKKLERDQNDQTGKFGYNLKKSESNKSSYMQLEHEWIRNFKVGETKKRTELAKLAKKIEHKFLPKSKDFSTFPKNTTQPIAPKSVGSQKQMINEKNEFKLDPYKNLQFSGIKKHDKINQDEQTESEIVFQLTKKPTNMQKITTQNNTKKMESEKVIYKNLLPSHQKKYRIDDYDLFTTTNDKNEKTQSTKLKIQGRMFTNDVT